jgi:hypothetical protein
MRLINRLIKLESKQKQQQVTCYELGWFYGEQSAELPLIPGLSLAAFYTNKPHRLVNEVNTNG